MRKRASVAIIGAAFAGIWAWATFSSADVAITPDDPRIGGLSGLVVQDAGRRFVALTDNGFVVQGRLQRQDGRLVAAVQDKIRKLRDDQGRSLKGDAADSEGLDMLPDGRFVVSFELLHRVSMFDKRRHEQPLPHGPWDRFRHPNRGLEALAVDPRGRVVVLSEKPRKRVRHFEVFRLEPTGWTTVTQITKANGFAIVGADFGPDGALYLLERRVGLVGFRSRIRRVDLPDGSAPRGLLDGQSLWAPNSSLGNLEGLSVWRDAGGDLRATMVADNNFQTWMPGGLIEIPLEMPRQSE